MITSHPIPITVTTTGCQCPWEVIDVKIVAQVGDYEYNTDEGMLAVPGAPVWVMVTVECAKPLHGHKHHLDWLITNGQQFYRCRNAQFPFGDKRRMPLLEANKQLILDSITEFMSKL